MNNNEICLINEINVMFGPFVFETKRIVRDLTGS